MLKTRILAIVSCLALLVASAAKVWAGGLSAETIALVEKRIAAEMARQKVPGLSAAIVVDHELAWSGGFGLADVENAVPATADTVFRLASVSKPITATAVMQLVEQEQLDLDVPVQKYVAGFPEKPWPITARQLLAHMSGIRHYRGEAEVLSLRRYDNLTAALAIFKDEPLLFEPGTKRTYTTYGYNLLGCAVEEASKQSFLDYLREHVFKPAGMEHTRDDSTRDLIRQRARGYFKGPAGELQNAPPFDASNKIPGGGLCSTSKDMARFAIALQTHKLLKPETFEQLCGAQKTSDGKPAGETNKQGTFIGQALGWFVSEDERLGRVLRHGGSQPGVKTVLLLAPREKLAVVVLANLSAAELDQLARQLAELVHSRK